MKSRNGFYKGTWRLMGLRGTVTSTLNGFSVITSIVLLCITLVTKSSETLSIV